MIVKDLDGLLHYGFGGPVVRPPEEAAEPEFGTLAWALQWLPPFIVAEFDCIRGPHEWVEVTACGVTRIFCKHCPRKITRR